MARQCSFTSYVADGFYNELFVVIDDYEKHEYRDRESAGLYEMN